MSVLNKIIAIQLRELADKFDAGTSNATEQQCLDILAIVGHERMSKTQACNYLNMPINTFNMYISKGIIPKGRVEKGYKELTWYKDELDKVIYKRKTKLTN